MIIMWYNYVVIIENGGKMPRIRKHESIKEKVWLIGPYIRLSKDDGNDESLSVTNQKKIIMEYFEKEFNEPYRIVDWYIDDGISGTTGDERVEFQRAVSDMKTGKINCIPCKTLSRAFRNYADQGYYLEQIFPSYNLRFISLGSPRVDTHLDPDAIIDGMELPINGLMNDRYAAKTSQDIRRTFDMKRRRGEFIGAFAPYGYKKDPLNKNKLIIDEEVAQVVKDIFHWRGNLEASKNGIVKKLNYLGILNPTAYKRSKGFNYNPTFKKNDGLWSPKTVYRILENEMYIGNMVQGKQKVISYKVHKKININEEDWCIVEDTHEAIIERDLFEKVQELNKRDTRVAPGNKRLYMLSGFVVCADCNRNMRRNSRKRKRKDGTETERVLYTCSTRAMKGVKFCKPNSMREELINEIVLKAIKLQIDNVANMAYVISEINKQSSTNIQSLRLTDQCSNKKEELKKIISAIDDLYLDWKSGDITKDDYIRMKSTFEEKTKAIRKVIENIEREINELSQGIGEDSPYLQTFLKHQNINVLDRSLLNELIDRIYLGENQEITIKFKFDDHQQDIVEFIESNQIN